MSRFASFLACVLWLGGLLSVVGCDDPPADAADGGVDASESDGGAPHMGFRLPACEESDPPPATPLPHVASTLESTLVPQVDRFAAAGPRNPATEMGEQLYREMDLHLTDVGPGQPHTHRADLGADSTATAGRRSIGWFAHLSDFQLVDDESPTRLASFDGSLGETSSAMRAQEASIPHAVSAMNRTFARVQRTERPLAFGVITGDCADSAQRNEIDWVIGVMNGTPGLHVDSGEDDDPVPGPDNDPKDPFDPTAFPAPWLFVPGNHDVEVTGITAPTAELQAQALGTTPTGGTRDYRRWYAPVTRTQVPADPERAIVSRDEIVAQLRASEATGPHGPPGHGYPATGTVDTSLGANYAYDAIPGLLRILALDTSDREGGSEGMVLQETVDGWLVPELERAETDGVLVMLASHHSTTSIDVDSGQFGGPVADALEPAAIEALVASYANVIAWLVGHSHDNRIRAIEGPDAEHPGYWEIMSAAIADYPGQTRTIELVDNGDGTLSIYGTLIDFDTDSCLEQRYRALLQMEWSSGWSGAVSRRPEDGNVELVRSIPTGTAAAITAATAGDRIESLTTLTGT